MSTFYHLTLWGMELRLLVGRKAKEMGHVLGQGQFTGRRCGLATDKALESKFNWRSYDLARPSPRLLPLVLPKLSLSYSFSWEHDRMKEEGEVGTYPGTHMERMAGWMGIRRGSQAETIPIPAYRLVF